MQIKKYVKKFFVKNPPLLERYVNIGMIFLNLAIKPISTIARHLITIQGLDPDSLPGETHLGKSLKELFDHVHDETYDSEYDYNWVKNKLETIQKNKRWGDITEETFVELTDLSKLSEGISTPLTIAKEDNKVLSNSSNSFVPTEDKLSDVWVQECENTKQNLNNLIEKSLAKSSQTLKNEMDIFYTTNEISELVEAARKAGIDFSKVPATQKSSKKSRKDSAKKRLAKKGGSFKEPSTRIGKSVKNKFNGNFTKSR